MSHAADLRAAERAVIDAAKKWSLLWCGHHVKGSPFASKAEAEAARDRLIDSANAAKQPVYGSYSIVPCHGSGRRDTEGGRA